MFRGLNSTLIYCLVDPEEGLVRYIGKADSPHRRYKEHVNNDSRSSTSSRGRWIAGLLNKGKVPIMVILDSVNKEDWERCEQEWIDHFEALSPGLLTNTRKK